MEAISLDAVTHEVAAANILAFAREDRLVQGEWHGRGGGGDGDQGRHIACLLGSIHPDINSVGDCPGDLMPQWMAYLTVRLFDGIPSDRMRHYGEAYGLRVAQWSTLNAAAWERVRIGFITEVFGGVITRAQARIGDQSPVAWPAAQVAADKLLALLLSGTATWKDYRAVREEAYAARTAAWAAYNAAVRRRREAAAEAEAAAAVAAEAAVAAAVAAVAVAAVAVAVAAVAAAAEAVAEAVAAVAEAVARRTSYAASFDTLLSLIDLELAA